LLSICSYKCYHNSSYDISCRLTKSDRLLGELKEDGFDTAYFGDIYLEDLKKYREDKLAEVGFKAKFPLWNIPTEKISKDFMKLGFETKIVAINGEKLDKSFVGRDSIPNSLLVICQNKLMFVERMENSIRFVLMAQYINSLSN
jgi:diphthamide synthase (EF-2-diphthine--ammonia ligase)